MNWQRLFSYGEVICFVSAWAVTLWMAAAVQRVQDPRPSARSIAAAGDIGGLQATLRR